MKARKLAKKVRRLERKVDALEKARMGGPLAAVEVDGPELDPHALLDECVERWTYGGDDSEDWSQRGYL